MGGGATQSVRENNIPFEGPNMTVVEIIHQFVMYILKVVQSGRGRRSVERRRFPTALRRIDVRVCHTCGAACKRCCGWWRRRGVGGGIVATAWMARKMMK